MNSIDLSGEWKFRKANGGRWMTARVPGDVYSDLFENGEIPDPFLGKNESEIQWVAREDWVYKKELKVPDEFLEPRKQLIKFDGLDTVSKISVNGVKVGETKNAHRGYKFDVGSYLRKGKNVLKVRFRSPVEYGLRKKEDYKYDLSPPRYPVDQPGREFVRKPQCQFGWDWGPSLPTVGIWRNVKLVCFSKPRIDFVTTEQEFRGDDVNLKVKAGLDVPEAGNCKFKIRIADRENIATLAFTPETGEVTREIEVKNPDLWWPSGHGEQALYPLRVEVGDDSWKRSIGFRQLELIREEDRKGESFYFEVNGIPIYARGANTIPLDALPGRFSRKRYSRMINSAAAANMNTLRVWGGGIYESNYFYELCDRRGILVWQDFAFACSPYPADEDFLQNVAEEVKYQARRLGFHPSLALWCGDNENEWLGKKGDYDSEGTDWDDIAKEYATLNETIRRTIEAEDPGRPFWPSSPSSSGQENPNDQSIGDTHYWDVWHGEKPFSDYLTTKPRFASEFGYQSFSSTKVLREALQEEKLNPTAPEVEYRQRHPRGNELIVRRMIDNFRFPFSFDDFTYLSQIQQGLAMKTAIEHWRRLKPHCMGTLYWQLNDVWPAISWSSLEYGGGWKALHHFAKRFYSPVLVSTREKEERLEIWLTSDVDQKIEGALSLSIFDLEGTKLNSMSTDLSLPELSSKKKIDLPIESILRGRAKEKVILEAIFVSGEYESRNYHFFAPFKEMQLKAPEVSRFIKDNNLLLKVEKPALFVRLKQQREQGSGRFTDNYFHLLPGEERKVSFLSLDDKHPVQLEDGEIGIKHLRSTFD